MSLQPSHNNARSVKGQGEQCSHLPAHFVASTAGATGSRSASASQATPPRSEALTPRSNKTLTHRHATYSCLLLTPEREPCPPKAHGSFAIRFSKAKIASPTWRSSLCTNLWLWRDGGHGTSAKGLQTDVLRSSNYCRSQRELQVFSIFIAFVKWGHLRLPDIQKKNAAKQRKISPFWPSAEKE